MNKDDVMSMAREAGITFVTEVGVASATPEWIERFAALVAAAEREACAKVCDEKVEAEYATGKVDHNEMGWTQCCAMDIRARGAP